MGGTRNRDRLGKVAMPTGGANGAKQYGKKGDQSKETRGGPMEGGYDGEIAAKRT